jgi:hypothetical protein
MRLPRAGLKKRCGVALLDLLDRAAGGAPEAHEWLELPPTFAARLEMPDRIEHAEACLFAARRLIVQMTGWLVNQQLAITRLSVVLEHERGRAAIEPTTIDIALAEPTWREDHLIRLFCLVLTHVAAELPHDRGLRDILLCERDHDGDMTVRENLLMGAFTRNDRAGIDEDYERMLDLFPRVRERLTQRAGTLSGGEQQMLAMARALMSRPSLICMDEPTMGLSPLYVDKVLDLIRTINQQGVTFFGSGAN